jgi:hypothetical protein
MPDKRWQQFLNRLELGSGCKTDAHLLLSKERIKAIKKVVFLQVEKVFNLKKLQEDVCVIKIIN